MRSLACTGLISVAALLWACPKEQPQTEGPRKAPQKPRVLRRITDDPSSAVSTLERQLAEARRRLSTSPQDLDARTQLVEMLLLKVQLLGQIEALDEMVHLAKGAQTSTGARALLLQARVLGARALYSQALKALAEAEAHGAPAQTLALRRAALRIAAGQGEAVLKTLQKPEDFESWTLQAMALADAGRFDEADRAFLQALKRAPGRSPFPVVWIQLSRARMWSQRAGQGQRARALYGEALAHLPQCAPASIEIASLEVQTKHIGAAIRRLEAVLERSSDPAALALLAQIKRQSNAPDKDLLKRAHAEYAALLKRHEAAYARTGAEFYLGIGDKPQTALSLARTLLKHEKSPRAWALGLQAALAAGDDKLACEWSQLAKKLQNNGTELRIVLSKAEARCPAKR